MILWIGIWFVLNILDAIGTWYGVSRGYAYEFNPTMIWAINQSWGIFFIIKISFSLIVVWLLWRNIKFKIVHWILYGCVAIYGLLVLNHIVLFILKYRGVI